MHKLGFPVWYGYGFEISRIIEEARDTGFDYIEVSIDHPWPRGGEPSLDEVVRLIKGSGLSTGFHAPWRDLRLSSPLSRSQHTATASARSPLYAISTDAILLGLSSSTLSQLLERILHIAS